MSGIAVAFLSLASSPMQHIMRDVRKYEYFCYDLYDNPEYLSICAESLANIYDQIIASIQHTSAEVVLFGANYDETITYKPFFDRYIAPWLNKASDVVRSAGKFLLTHTDGENKGLLDSYKSCRFDIADSICPAPMTKVSFQEYREFFADNTTIWGGIPSVIMLRDSYSDDEFRDYVQMIISDSEPYDHLILSIADTTPPDADFNRLLYLSEACFNT